MAKVEECTHVELYTVSFSDIELVGSKIILCIYLNDITKNIITKRVSLSISNIPNFMKDAGVSNLGEINRKDMRCLINKLGEVNYISLGTEWFVCKDIHISRDL